ncbi:MAG TPA: glycosyltransferase family 2 protein [Acidobacteriota bacterium]|nr:glycosyltransferase family 2 protein [Acidobacteriota bacterium]
MTDRPLFSIVIPTRNRAGLLRYALRSALAQTWPDYEILVSDNDSSDTTPAVVKETGGGRVRYVRTPTSLSMPDSWEFALSHAEGQFVTYLCDDDAIAPELLATVAQVIEQRGSEVITWACGGYYHPNWEVAAQRNSATLPPVSNSVQSLESRSALSRLFSEMWPTFPVPKMLQSCCSKKVLNEIHERVGRLFIPTCPDLSSPVLILDAVARYDHIDRILMISGAAMESNGARQWSKDRANMQDFAREFGLDGMFQEVPLRVLVGINFAADTLLRTKKLMEARLQDINLDWERYYVLCFEGLNTFEKLGADTMAEMQEFQEVLGHQPADFQRKVWRTIKSRRPSPWRQDIREAINHSRFLTQLELRLRPKVRDSRQRVIQGEQGGFGNIAECAARIASLTGDMYRQPRAV